MKRAMIRDWATYLSLVISLFLLIDRLWPDGKREVNSDNYLQVPALITFPNKEFARPFEAKWKGLRVRYTGNIFSVNQPDLIYKEQISKNRYLLPWQTSENGGPGLGGIFEGNILQFVDNEIYDLSVGALFARVRNESTGFEGFVSLETIFGECEPYDRWNIVAKDPEQYERISSLVIGNTLFNMLFISRDQASLDQLLMHFEAKDKWTVNFSGGQTGGGVHPVFAANQLNSILVAYFEESNLLVRDRILSAARVFFEDYVFRNAKEVGGGLSWPYSFEWNMNWGIKLSPPWYSAYASASFAQAAALMFKITKEPRFNDLAIASARFVGAPLHAGGAEYRDRGFRFPAEYIYGTPPLPNVRVLDGELLVVNFLFNSARLVGDSEVLQIAIRHGVSLNQAMDYYENDDGTLMFASYVEKMPEGYSWLLWSKLQSISGLIKHPRMRELAERMTRHIPSKWCDTNGC